MLNAVLVAVLAIVELGGNTVPRGPMPRLLLWCGEGLPSIVEQAKEWPATEIAGLIFSPDAIDKVEDDEALANAVVGSEHALFLTIPVRNDFMSTGAVYSSQDLLVLARAVDAGITSYIVDTDPSDSHFYTGNVGSAVTQDATAGQSGMRRYGEAAIAALPDDEEGVNVLIDARGYESAGPYYWEFLAGIIDAALLRYPPSAVDVLFDGRVAGEDAAEFEARIARFHAMVDMRLSGRAQEGWRYQSGFAMALSQWPEKILHGPFDWYCGEALAERLSTSLHARRYVVADLPDMPGAPAEQKETSLCDAFAVWRRAGTVPVAGETAWSAYSVDGAALLFPDGVAEQLSVPASKPVQVYRGALVGPNELAPSVDGDLVVDGSPGPVVLNGLPIREFALPAGFWVDAYTPIEPGIRSSVSYGFFNETGFDLSGALHALTAPRYGLVPSETDIHVATGQGLAVQSSLAGALEPGNAVPLELALVQASGSVATHEFELRVAPKLAWTRGWAAPLTVAATVLDLDDNGDYEIIASDETGALFAIDGAGTVLWAHHLEAPLVAPAVAARQWNATPMVVALCDDQRVLAFDALGAPLWETGLAVPIAGTEGIAADLHPFPGTEIVVPQIGGRATVLLANGETLREHEFGDGPLLVAAANIDDSPGDELLVSGGAPAYLRCLNSDGTERWASALPGSASSRPAVARSRNGATMIAAGTANGMVSVVDGGGSEVHSLSSKNGSRVLSASFSEALTVDGLELFVTARSGIRCFSATGEMLWEIDAAVAAPGTVGQGAKGTVLIAPLDDDTLLCVDALGSERWRDSRSAHRLSAAPVVYGAGEALHCVIGSRDHTLRVYEIR